MKAMKKILRYALGRNWVMPVIAVLGNIACTGMAVFLCGLTISAAVEERHWLGNILDYVLGPQLLLFLGLPLWLLALTVFRLRKRQYYVGWAWFWSFLAGLAMLPCLIISSFSTSFGDYDDFTLGIRVPDELAPERNPGMAVPVDMHFQPPLSEGDGATLPPIVQQYADLCETDNGVHVSDDEALPDKAPNVEKLAADAPELLKEYTLRAFCHRALTPGVKVTPHISLLQHPDTAFMHQTEERWHEEKAEIWQIDLPNRWKIYNHAYRWGKHEIPSAFERKRLKLLDEAMAPLAAEPTREKLNALLPPLPDKPVIVLAEHFQPGIYLMTLVVPRDYPEGSFRVTAREYTKGTELSTRVLDTLRLTPRPCGSICQLASADSFTVYSGEWGEYYASVWELHFTPADGGESRCVNSQLYLMQGWSR